jgi:hypothetical protein
MAWVGLVRQLKAKVLCVSRRPRGSDGRRSDDKGAMNVNSALKYFSGTSQYGGRDGGRSWIYARCVENFDSVLGLLGHISPNQEIVSRATKI